MGSVNQAASMTRAPVRFPDVQSIIQIRWTLPPNQPLIPLQRSRIWAGRTVGRELWRAGLNSPLSPGLEREPGCQRVSAMTGPRQQTGSSSALSVREHLSPRDSLLRDLVGQLMGFLVRSF